MKLSVLGAAGFIGSEVVNQALAKGLEVRALTRRSGQLASRTGLEIIVGDATDSASLNSVLAGSTAVLSCIGGAGDLAGTMTAVLAAMRAADVSRLVAISGAGITVPGERKPMAHRLASVFVRLLAARVVAAKQAEFEVLLAASDIDWTTLRPPRVVDGPASGRARASLDASQMAFRVTRGDVAEVMLAEIVDRSFVRRAAYITGR